MINKKFYITAIALLIIISTVFSACTNGKDSKKILLRIVIEYSDLGPLDGGKDYFNVYSNGKYEKIDEFKLSDDIESYSFDEIQSKYKNNEDLSEINLPPYALEILKASEEIGNNFVTQEYIIDNNYYFAIADTRTIQNKYTSVLYQYFPEKDKYKKIVGFEKGYIKHIEGIEWKVKKL